MTSFDEELKELESNLSNPEFLKDYKRVTEASKRYAEIQRMLEACNNPRDKAFLSTLFETGARIG